MFRNTTQQIENDDEVAMLFTCVAVALSPRNRLNPSTSKRTDADGWTDGVTSTTDGRGSYLIVVESAVFRRNVAVVPPQGTKRANEPRTV